MFFFLGYFSPKGGKRTNILKSAVWIWYFDTHFMWYHLPQKEEKGNIFGRVGEIYSYLGLGFFYITDYLGFFYLHYQIFWLSEYHTDKTGFWNIHTHVILDLCKYPHRILYLFFIRSSARISSLFKIHISLTSHKSSSFPCLTNKSFIHIPQPTFFIFDKKLPSSNLTK